MQAEPMYPQVPINRINKKAMCRAARVADSLRLENTSLTYTEAAAQAAKTLKIAKKYVVIIEEYMDFNI